MSKKDKKDKDENIVTQRTIVEKENEKGEIGLVDKETGEVVFPYGDYDFSSQSTKAKSLIFLCKYNNNRDLEYFGIYDKALNKVVANHWKVVGEIKPVGHELLYLENPETGKLHLFDDTTYGTKNDAFDVECTKIKFLGDYLGVFPYALTNSEGKQALYVNQEGFVTDFEYDSIIDDVRIIILTKGNKKRFVLAYDHERRFSKEYDRIKSDGKFIYCQDGGKCEVFLEGSTTADYAFTVECDDLIEIGEVEDKGNIHNTEKGVFLRRKKNKFGLLERIENQVKTRTLVGTKYDKISLFPETDDVLGGAVICLLEKNKKYGLFGYQGRSSYNHPGWEHKVEAKYDKIELIFEYNIFALHKGDKCDIYDLENDKKIIVDCDNYDVFGDYIIYKKGNKHGIYCLEDGSNYFGYDGIVNLGNNLFMVDENGKKGLLHLTDHRGIKKVVDLKYKSIKTREAISTTEGYYETLFLSLENMTGGHELSILDLTENWSQKDKLKKPVCAYKDVDLSSFSPDAKVYLDRVDLADGKKADLLIVNDEYYVFINGRFISVDPSLIPEYEYQYTSQYGEVGMIFHSKKEFDAFTRKMKKLSSEKIDEIFIGLNEQSPRAQEKFPELTRRKNDNFIEQE